MQNYLSLLLKARCGWPRGYSITVFKLTGIKEEKDRLKKERVAILIHLDKHRQSLVDVTSELEVSVIEGKLNNIIQALKGQNVFLLKGGALEHYLPSYAGDIYEVNDSIKRQTIEKETELLFTTLKVDTLEERYGYLFEVIKSLPAEPKVDYLKPIKSHLGSLIYKIQRGIQAGLITSAETIPNYIGNEWQSFSRVLEVQSLDIDNSSKFKCLIKIFDKWGIGEISLVIDENTNPGMGKFDLVKNKEAEVSETV